jgi:hypothetical protein
MTAKGDVHRLAASRTTGPHHFFWRGDVRIQLNNRGAAPEKIVAPIAAGAVALKRDP